MFYEFASILGRGVKQYFKLRFLLHDGKADVGGFKVKAPVPKGPCGLQNQSRLPKAYYKNNQTICNFGRFCPKKHAFARQA